LLSSPRKTDRAELIHITTAASQLPTVTGFSAKAVYPRKKHGRPSGEGVALMPMIGNA